MEIYNSIEEFNEDAERRYREIVAERHGMSYDRWWSVDKLQVHDTGALYVVWARVGPHRKF